jgi:hypothetical protein
MTTATSLIHSIDLNFSNGNSPKLNDRYRKSNKINDIAKSLDSQLNSKFIK